MALLLTKSLPSISPDEINSMSYVDFISLLRETNRCPGGKATIRRILQNTFVCPNSYVLEIGSNTGFSSLEVARTAKCRVVGIDPVGAAVSASKKLLEEDDPSIRGLIEFRVGSAYEIPAPDNSFDLIIAGGATSFMDQKQRAVSEYFRVLKPWGFLSVANFYYETTPPQNVVDSISNIIGTKIEVWGKDDWKRLFSLDGKFEEYWTETAEIEVRTEEQLNTSVAYFLDKPHIQNMSTAARDAIHTRWKRTLQAFNENHKYARFQIIIWRKPTIYEEPEIFPARFR